MSNIVSTKTFFQSEQVKAKFNELLGKKSQGFLTSVLQVVSNNKLLQSANPQSVYMSAMMAATLDLPINNNLGFAYIVPYKRKFKDENGRWSEIVEAQFQIGYKGFIQLALRSGQFRSMNAVPIYNGQITKNDPFQGFEFDFSVEPEGEPIGYCAYFKLLNGFEQYLYMTKAQVKSHAQRYSQSAKRGDGVWVDNFDEMSLKTVLKRIFSKFAPLSIEMQNAIQADQAIIKDVESMEVEYIDNEQQSQISKPKLESGTPAFENLRQQVASGELTINQILERYEVSESDVDLLAFGGQQ